MSHVTDRNALHLPAPCLRSEPTSKIAVAPLLPHAVVALLPALEVLGAKTLLNLTFRRRCEKTSASQGLCNRKLADTTLSS